MKRFSIVNPKSKILNLLIGLAILFLPSCSTDFDTVAPYQETTVVYGLLNQNENVQFIRISKAYLGEGNALIMAKEKDSIYYREQVEVKLERLRNNFIEATEILTPVDTILKDPGVFYGPDQVVYATSQGFVTNNDESLSYRLTVTNKLTGHVASSTTKAIKILSTSGDRKLEGGFPIDFTRDQTFKFSPSPIGKIYNMTIKVRYTEETTPGTAVKKSFDWNLFDKTISTYDSRTTVDYVVSKEDFFKAIGENVEQADGILRRFDHPPLEIRLTAGTEELYTYIQVTKPSSGVIQDRPLYTNISNGVGLFSSRLVMFVTADLNQGTILAMDTSQFTKTLNFKP